MLSFACLRLVPTGCRKVRTESRLLEISAFKKLKRSESNLANYGFEDLQNIEPFDFKISSHDVMMSR
eukprot:scaffold6475_cov155-Ochromonas_danica.AAC.3